MLDPNKLYGVGGNKSLRETVEREYINEMLNDVRRAADDAITRIHNAPPFESMFSEDPVYIGTWVNGKKIYRHVKWFDTRNVYLGEIWDGNVRAAWFDESVHKKVSCVLQIPLGNHDAVWTNAEENAALKRYNYEEIFIVNEPDTNNIGTLNPTAEIVLTNGDDILQNWTDIPFRVGVNRDGSFWTPSDAFSDVQFSEDLVEINNEWTLIFKFDITCAGQYHFLNLPKEAGYHRLFRVINYVE